MSTATTSPDSAATLPAADAPPSATQLAIDRTRLAFERTTMAWVRTATSLITFGSSVYKFFQIEANKEVPGRIIGPREFALMMISIGIFALIIATVQHVQSMRTMRAHSRGMHVPRSLAALVGGLMSLLGLLALIAVVLRR
jgi:putative membrane protein